MDAIKHKTVSILRWSEKYTKTDMVYLFNNSFWVFVGQAATSVTAFVVMVVLANLLSKEVLGEYRFIISAITILSVFTLQGMNPAVVQSVAKGYKLNLEEIIATKFKWGLMGMIVTAGISLYYAFQGNESLSIAFLVVALALPFYGLYFLYFFYLQGQQKFAQASITQAIGRIFFMIVMLGAALFTPTLVPLTAAFLITTIVGQYGGYVWMKKRTTNTNDEDPELASYAKEITILGAFPLIAANIDKILVWNMLGAVPLAIYAIALIFPQESFRLGRIVSQVVLPRLSRDGAKIMVVPFIKKLLIFEGVMVLGWMFYAVSAPLLFSIFFPTYMESVMISVVAMLALLTMPIYLIRQFFIAHKFKKELNRVLVVTPILQTAILYFGLLWFGIAGAIFAFVIGGFLELMIGCFYLYKIHNSRQARAII